MVINCFPVLFVQFMFHNNTQSKTEKLKIETWNVRSMNICEKLENKTRNEKERSRHIWNMRNQMRE